MTLRLFVGIGLPPEVKDALAQTQAQLRQDGRAVSWAAPETLHLTLHFLGSTDPALVEPIGAALRAALQGHNRFELRLGPAGVFPNPRRPNVFWQGVEGAVPALKQLQEQVVAALEPLGFKREQRPYSPHLTLGRARRDADPAALERLGARTAGLPAPATLAWTVERVSLFQSELLPGGPRYTPLDTVDLTP